MSRFQSQVVRDLLLGLFVTAVVQADLALPGPDRNPWAPGDALYSLLFTLPVFWRRRSPLTGLLIILAATTASPVIGLGSVSQAWIPIVVAAYSVALFSDLRRLRFAGLILPPLAVLLREVLLSPGRDPGNILILAVLPAGAWLVGDQVRARANYIARLQQRTAEIAKEQEARKLEVISNERARIARELQEVITQGVSAMAVQAGAARASFDSDRKGAQRALENIEANSREALVEMRRLLGLLRTEQDVDLALAPQPSLSRLDALVDEMKEHGVTLRLEVDGEMRPLSVGLDLSVYRLIEAAIAGAEGGGDATIRLTYRPRDLELEVVSPWGRVADRDDGAGSTFAQMRERVALFGGDFELAEDRGELRMNARFPLEQP